MRGRLVWAWLGVGLALLAAAAVRAAEEPQWVKVGKWQLRTESFFSGHGPTAAFWHGKARGPRDQEFELYIGSKKEGASFRGKPQELQVPGLGTMEVTAADYDEGHWQFAFVRAGQTLTAEGYMEARGRPDATKAEFLVTPGVLAVIDLFKGMLSERVPLGSYRYATDFPQLTVTIDDGEPATPNGQPGVRGAEWGWELRARPGQALRLNVSFQAAQFVVTTWGIERTDAPAALAGRQVTVREHMPGGQPLARWVLLDEKGAGDLVFGTIRSARMLDLDMERCFGTHSTLSASIVLRWGRPEEQWLQTGRFPLSGPPQGPSLESTVRTLAADLEAAFDPDTGQWFGQWESGGTYPWESADADAAAGLDTAAFPHLTGESARSGVRPWLRRFALFTVGRSTPPLDDVPSELEQAIRSAVEESRGPRPWEPLQATLEHKGWHDPRQVCGLALFWQQRADLRAAVPLERILDFWCESLKTQPFPVRPVGMAGGGEDRSLDSLACAVAALQVGYAALPKLEYTQARDSLLARMREVGSKEPLYQAMVRKADPGYPPSPRWATSQEDVVNFAAVYGQTCAFIGNTEELGKVRDWAAAVLARQGDNGQKLYQRYQYAPFATRCALLAAVRGRSPMFAGPPPEEGSAQFGSMPTRSSPSS